MDDNFNQKDINDTFAHLQPGDERTFTVTIRNDHKDSTDWYMENEIIKSLEQATESAKATGTGGYTYLLKYNDREIFNSETVGGEGSEGLHGATDNLEEWFYLDSLTKGKSGTITLKVGLDGETQGNAYEDTAAQLALRFAVELNETPTTPDNPPTPTNVVKTGDETQLSPMIIMAAVSGLILLLLAIYGVKIRRDQKKEVA